MGWAGVKNGSPTIREISVQRYRLLYDVRDTEVHILALLHGARDFTAWRRTGSLDPDIG